MAEIYSFTVNGVLRETAEYDTADAGCGLPEDIRVLIQTVRSDYSYLVK